MDRARIAEWLLRQVVTADRAAALVGDELESSPSAGNPKFWLSISRLMLALGWRTLVALVVSPVLASLFAGLALVACMVPLGEHGYFDLPGTSFFGYYLAVCELLWGAAAFSLVRFGLRNTLTITSLAAALLSTAATCSLWAPRGEAASCVALLIFILVCLRKSKTRRALGMIFLALSSTTAIAYLLLGFRIHRSGSGSSSFITNRSTPLWHFVGTTFLLFLTESVAISLLHTKLFAKWHSAKESL